MAQQHNCWPREITYSFGVHHVIVTECCHIKLGRAVTISMNVLPPQVSYLADNPWMYNLLAQPILKLNV